MNMFRRKENQSGYYRYFTEESLLSDTEAADIQDELLIGAVRDVMIPKLSPDPNNNRSMISMTDPKNFVIHRYIAYSSIHLSICPSIHPSICTIFYISNIYPFCYLSDPTILNDYTRTLVHITLHHD